MNPTPASIAIIRARIVSLGLSWSQPANELLSALHADTQPNPVPPLTVTAPFQATDMIGVLAADPTKIHTLIHSPAFVGALWPLLDAPNPKTQDQVRQLRGWLQALVAGGDLTADENTAILAIVDKTQPDPTYRAAIPALELQLGRPFDVDDIVSSNPGV